MKDLTELLNEGLFLNDLEDLISKNLEIDTFKPKVLKDGIVVVFKVMGEDPAYDLSSFIERGPGISLDTEVSDAPDIDGYYYVFVEFKRDPEFPKALLDILQDMQGITGIKTKEWKFLPYKYERLREVNEYTLRNYVRLLEKDEDELDDLEESLEFFLKNENFQMLEEAQEFKLQKGKFEYWCIEKPTFLTRRDYNRLVRSGKAKLDENSLLKSRHVARQLGPGWDVTLLENGIILHKDSIHILLANA